MTIIRMFLKGETFDPEIIESMSAALVGACRALGLKVKDDPAIRLLAGRIVEHARTGETNAERLRAAALADFQCSQPGGFPRGPAGDVEDRSGPR